MHHDMKMGLFTIAMMGIILFGGMAHALAQAPPEGLSTSLKTMVKHAYNVAYSDKGWSSQYALPQSQFSTDESDFFDPDVRFSGIGYYALGLNGLTNPQYVDLDLNAGIKDNILAAGQKLLNYTITPPETQWGVHDGQNFPGGNVVHARDTVQGVGGASNVCQPLAVKYNIWSVPEGTTNTNPESKLETLAGAGISFLLASDQLPTAQREPYITTAKGIADTLMSALITPDDVAFGIHPSQTKDAIDKTIPVGMLPLSFTLKPEADTPACQDGGTIKLGENDKTQMAFAAYFLHLLSTHTEDDKYQQASTIITNGILDLAECDGTFRNYTRWEGPDNKSVNCTASDGQTFTAHQGNVTSLDTRGQFVDNGFMLYLLEQATPDLYNSNQKFKNAVQFYLELEEKDTDGGGYKKNGSPYKYASYSLTDKYKTFGRVMMSDVFLYAACHESNSDLEKRLETKAYTLLTLSTTSVSGEIESKIADALFPNVGISMLGTAATADAWKVVAKGCANCTDKDGDGYIDGVCAGDTVKYDCNDNDKKIHPGATEVCDGVDNDCDGKIDNGFDKDGDGVPVCAGDCNDNDKTIHPGAPEVIDQKDNDCNNKVDDTGILAHVLDDHNAPVSNTQVNFVTYGNACVSGYAQKVENFSTIRTQCKIEADCTTDANGSCLGFFKVDGKYQAFTGVGSEALFSGPIDFHLGQRIDMNMQAHISASDLNVAGTGTTSTAGTSDQPNYLFMGLVVIIVVVGGIGVALFYRTGKLSSIKLSFGKPSGGSKPSVSSKPAPAAPAKPIIFSPTKSGTASRTTPNPKSDGKASAPAKKAETTLKKEMNVAPAPGRSETPKAKWKASADKSLPKESQ